MYCTQLLTKSIQENTPIIFMKLGDGEYNCATYARGSNCDLDAYSAQKGVAIVDAMCYLTESGKNSYFGLWWNSETRSYWEEQTNASIQWVNYHSINIDNDDMSLKNNILKDKIQFFKTIQQSPLKKIYVCNKLLRKAKQLLKIDSCVHVSLQNWFDTDFQRVLEEVKNIFDEKGTICLFSAGMAAKPLLAELVKLFPNGIFIDIGSALDFLCTGHDTRGWSYSYEELESVFQEILPENWKDSEFYDIQREAKQHLGKHLHH